MKEVQKNTRLLAGILFSLLLCLQLACSSTTADDSEDEDETLIHSEEIQAPLAAFMEFPGMIDVPPYSVHEIHARTKGFIREIHVLEGQHVKKGDVLASIESPEFAALQKEYLSAEALYNWQEKSFFRTKSLYASGSVSEKEFQLAEKDYVLAKSQYKGLKAELQAIGFDTDKMLDEPAKQLHIRSTTHGMVTKIDVHTGTHVIPESHLFTLIDKSHMHIEIFVPSGQMHQVSDSSRFFIIHNSDTLHGEVYLINYQVENDNTVRIHGHFTDERKAQAILPGQRYFVKMLARQP